MESLYRGILKQAWGITKKFKWLWLFGLFAAFLGNGGEIDILLQNNKLTDAPNFLLSLKEAFATLDPAALRDGFFNALATQPLLTVLSTAIFIVFVIFFIWLITVSQGGLIEGVNKLDAGKKISFKDALHKGSQKFWSLFGLNLLTSFLVYFILIILSIPFAALYLVNSSPLAILFITLFAFILLVPIAIIISFVLKYAFAYVIIKDQPALNAFILAWRLFVANWLISLEMAVILFIVNVIVGIALVLGLILIMLPFIGLFILLILFQNETGINIIAALGVFIALVLIFIVGAGLATFQYASWTLLFQKLLTGKKYPKLVRLVAGTEKNINK